VTVAELHALALALAKVMAAFDAMGIDDDPRTRVNFEAEAKDGLARVLQIVACQLADAKDAGRAEARAEGRAREAAAYRRGLADAERGPA